MRCNFNVAELRFFSIFFGILLHDHCSSLLVCLLPLLPPLPLGAFEWPALGISCCTILENGHILWRKHFISVTWQCLLTLSCSAGWSVDCLLSWVCWRASQRYKSQQTSHGNGQVIMDISCNAHWLVGRLLWLRLIQLVHMLAVLPLLLCFSSYKLTTCGMSVGSTHLSNVPIWRQFEIMAWNLSVCHFYLFFQF